MCIEKNKNETLTVCSLVTRRFVFDVLNAKFEVLVDMVRQQDIEEWMETEKETWTQVWKVAELYFIFFPLSGHSTHYINMLKSLWSTAIFYILLYPAI